MYKSSFLIAAPCTDTFYQVLYWGERWKRGDCLHLIRNCLNPNTLFISLSLLTKAAHVSIIFCLYTVSHLSLHGANLPSYCLKSLTAFSIIFPVLIKEETRLYSLYVELSTISQHWKLQCSLTKPQQPVPSTIVYGQHLSNLTFNEKFFSFRFLLIILTFDFNVSWRKEMMQSQQASSPMTNVSQF